MTLMVKSQLQKRLRKSCWTICDLAKLSRPPKIHPPKATPKRPGCRLGRTNLQWAQWCHRPPRSPGTWREVSGQAVVVISFTFFSVQWHLLGQSHRDLFEKKRSAQETASNVSSKAIGWSTPGSIQTEISRNHILTMLFSWQKKKKSHKMRNAAKARGSWGPPPPRRESPRSRSFH